MFRIRREENRWRESNRITQQTAMCKCPNILNISSEGESGGLMRSQGEQKQTRLTAAWYRKPKGKEEKETEGLKMSEKVLRDHL